MVELILQPTRAANVAKLELSRSFHSLYECASLFGDKPSKAEIMESQKKLRSHLNALKKFTEEAQAEPNFWFLPFNSSCYESYSNHCVQWLIYCNSAVTRLGFLENKEKENYHNPNLLRKSLLKSLDALEKALVKNGNSSWDIELGKTPNRSFSNPESEPEKILNTYLQHCREVMDDIFRAEEEGEEVQVYKSEFVLSLSALWFCVDKMGKEAREIEEMVKEVVQSENPSSHVNLHEISCKIRSLYK